jgi:hypothetical protein
MAVFKTKVSRTSEPKRMCSNYLTYNSYQDEILKKWKLVNPVIKLNTKYLQNTSLAADDQIIVQKSQDDLQKSRIKL